MGNTFSLECPHRNQSRSSEEACSEEVRQEPETSAPWKGVDIPCDVYWRGSLDTLCRFWPAIISYSLESYEQSLYGLAINAIKFNFFANSAGAAWLCYAIPYFTRPIGGVGGGWLSDRYGRRIIVISSAYAMVLTTVAQGLVPSGSGVFGMGALVALRMLQGLAYGSTASLAVYTAEVVPKHSIGKGIMLLSIGSGLGALTCTFMFAMLEQALDTGAMYSWGWRVPYLVVFLPGLLSAIASHGLPESPDYEAQVGQHENLSLWEALKSIFTDYGLQVVLYVGLCMTNASIMIITRSYLVDWLPTYAGISDAGATWLVLLNCFVALAVSPYTAYLTDTVGPSRVLLAGYGSTLVLTLPLFALTLFGPNVYASGIALSVVFGAGNALGIPVTLLAIGLFPPEMRAISSGLLHNAEHCLFSGLSPAFVTWLCEFSALAPAYYLFATELLTVMSVLGLMYARRGGTKMSHLREIPF